MRAADKAHDLMFDMAMQNAPKDGFGIGPVLALLNLIRKRF